MSGAELDGETAADDFGKLFSLRRPKDATGGLTSGLKNLAKGVAAGVVGLVAAPVVGAAEGGVVGGLKGAGAGLVGAVVFPVAGVVTGTAQIVRGVANTPEAIRARGRGATWDLDRREWVEAPGDALVLDTPATQAARRAHQAFGARPGGGRGGGGQVDASRPVVDYYALLGVQKSADASEIRRRYFLLARTAHPDKHPDDPEAPARFQALSEAYQVLSDPQRRARYDAGGKDAAGGDFADGAEFFAALFGSDAFEHLVGELLLASAARDTAVGADGGPAASAAAAEKAALEARQAERERHLAENLQAILRRWVEGDEEGFTSSMEAEAAELVKASYGDVMLRAIGRAYDQQARIAADGVLGGAYAALRTKGHSIKTQFDAVGMALRVYHAQRRIAELEAQEAGAVAAAQAARDELRRREEEAGAAGAAGAIGAADEVGEAGGSPRAGAGSPPPPTAFEASGAAAAAGAAASGPPGGAAPVPASPGDPASPASPPASAIGSTDKLPAGLKELGLDPSWDLAEVARAATEVAQESAKERAKLEEQSLPLMLDAMWAANVLDVQSTLKHVCKTVLRDPSVSPTVRRRRAGALRELGRVFKAAAVRAGSDERLARARKARDAGAGDEERGQVGAEARERMEAAMRAVVDRRVAEEEKRDREEARRAAACAASAASTASP